MGYQFDSTSNFNATWSNSYGTIVCAPGQAVGSGFARASGKTYFEFVVDSQPNNGPARGNLYLGGLWRGGASQWTWLFGGNKDGAYQINNATGDLSAKLPTYGSLTWATGDVIGVAVNYSADGIGGMSSLTFTGQCVIEISKNGTFLGQRAVFSPSGAFVGFRPLVTQDSGTTLSVVVSLRVDAASLSYMPAGYSQWGPSGGLIPGVTVPTITWGWINTIPAGSPGAGQASKGAQWSISGTDSVKVATYGPGTLSASLLNVPFVRTKSLPLDKKVVFEVIAEMTKTYSSNWQFGFVKESAAVTLTVSGLTGSRTQTGLYATVALGGSQGVYIEGSLSTTATHQPVLWGGSIAGREKLAGYLYNPTRGFIFYGAAGISNNGFFDVESGIQRLSLTSSVTMFGLFSFPPGNVTNNTAHFGKKWYINDGRLRRLSMPLFPGWWSLNKTYYVSGGDTYWTIAGLSTTAADTVKNEISCFVIANGNNSKVIKANKGHSSGKRYFELQFHMNNPSVTGEIGGGVANASCSFSHTSAGALTNFYGMMLANGPTRRTVRDNVTLSTAEAISLTIEGVYLKLCVAVDFDAGNIWLGRMQATAANVPRSVLWFSGDPATGTSPLITFTASTTLYPSAFANAGGASQEVNAWAAFEDSGFAHDPPTGFVAWATTTAATTPTTTATVTPSFTGCISGTNAPGGSLRVNWPFGVRP